MACAWLGLASARLYYTAPYRFSISMFRAPVLIPHSLGLGLACCVCGQQIPYDVPLPSNTSSGIHAVTQAWLGSARFVKLASENSLGLVASARLYYTAPYRFSVSMFRAPVLIHWLGLGWAWVKLSPSDKFDKLNLVLIGLDWIIIIFALFLFNACLPIPGSPKAFRYKWPLSSSSLSWFGCYWAVFRVRQLRVFLVRSFYCLHVYLIV